MSARPFLFAGALALTVAAFGQSTPATNRPNPPAPPRPDAPGAPINPRQANTPSQTEPATAATEEIPALALRELNFAEADADHDKKVSLTEFSNYVGNRPANRSTDPISTDLIEKFRQLDQDGDAMLTEAEANTPAPQLPLQQQPTPRAAPPRR